MKWYDPPLTNIGPDTVMGLFFDAVNISNKGSGSPPLILVVLAAAALPVDRIYL